MDLIIQRTAQVDLCDNEPRHVFDEASDWISRSCPDWNKPGIKKTYMIPPTFPDLDKKKELEGQFTEKHVFDILEEFGDKTEQPMLVVHSHNYKFSKLMQNFQVGIVKEFNGYGDREYDGETDFVIIHRTLGVIFFQVKAGIKTPHRYGPAIEQLKKDRMAMACSLKQLCLEELGTTVEAEMKKCQGFVVMPNCPRKKAQDKDGCFREDIQSAADFAEWWQKNIHRTGVPEFSEDMYKLMAVKFVGLRVVSESCLLKDVIDKTHSRIIMWTKDQLSIRTQDVPKQDIKGPAGSGKTLLLLEKAKEVAGKLKENERILIMCFNRPLSLFLDAKVENFPNSEQIVVRTFVSILKEIKGPDWKALPVNDREERYLVYDCVKKLQANPDLRMRYRYEHVFVDEGQDMYGTWMNLVSLLHADSDVERRYRWVFFDSNQTVHFGSQNNIPQETIDNAKPMHRIVRNTFNIFHCSRKFLSPDVTAELDHGIVGKQVKLIGSLPNSTDQVSPSDDVVKKGAELVKQEIDFLDSESVARSDIVVLTNDMPEREKVRDIFEDDYYIKTQVAEEAIQYPDKHAITVDSIRRFKGLERKVVILFDPPIDGEDVIMMDLNYVAMSRCFCYLVIVTSQQKKQKFAQKFARKESDSRKRKQKSEKFTPKKPRT